MMDERQINSTTWARLDDAEDDLLLWVEQGVTRTGERVPGRGILLDETAVRALLEMIEDYYEAIPQTRQYVAGATSIAIAPVFSEGG